MKTKSTMALFGALITTLAMSGTLYADPAEKLSSLQSSVLSKGPNGEDPASAADITLTDDELAKIKGMNATAAIVMHYGGNDWSQAQINGLETQFAAMGIDVIAVTDAGYKIPLRGASRLNFFVWHLTIRFLCVELHNKIPLCGALH